MSRDWGEGGGESNLQKGCCWLLTFLLPGAVVILTYSSESSSDDDIYVSGRGFDRLVLS